MEYSVGSLADLISGKNTPNKPKIVKVPLVIKNEDENQANITESVTSKKDKKKNGKSVNKSKKRKAIDDSEENVKIKRSKNDKNTFVDSEEETPVTENKETTIAENDVPNASEPRKRHKKVKKVQDPEEMARTIFVGNVPLKTEKKRMKRHFKKYGPIESLRFRGIPVANPKVPKKVAAIKKEFHPDRKSIYCYIRFVNKEDAEKAVAENGALFEEHHLRVHSCSIKEKPDETKAIFIGNLSFDAEEEDLWKLFETCGAISHVRIVRDSYTGMAKGFAYVNFEESDSVQLALEMENVMLKNRVMRISPSSVRMAKKNKKNSQKKNFKEGTQKNQPFKDKKNFHKNNGKWRKPNVENGNSQGSTFNDDKNNGKWNKSNTQSGNFQGSKFNINKKHKVNKGLLDKKRNIKRIAPISK